MKQIIRFSIVLVIYVSVVKARSAESNSHTNVIDANQTPRSNDGIFEDIQYVYQLYKDCAGSEMSSCLKLKLLTLMDRVSRNVQLNIVEGISVIKDSPTVNDDSERSIEEIESDLPRSLSDREDALNSMIIDKAFNFLQSRTLKVKFPNIKDLRTSLSDEGRGKKRKGMGGLMAIPLLIGGTLIPLALGALALLAGKALIVSKLALVLASIIGLKKLVSHHDGHDVVQVGHSGGGWARSNQDHTYSNYKESTLS